MVLYTTFVRQKDSALIWLTVAGRCVPPWISTVRAWIYGTRAVHNDTIVDL